MLNLVLPSFWLIQIYNYLQTRAKPGTALPTALSLNNTLIHTFPPKALRRRHGQTVRDISSGFYIDYANLIKSSLNPEGHQNCIVGLRVRAILLDGGKFAFWWISSKVSEENQDSGLMNSTIVRHCIVFPQRQALDHGGTNAMHRTTAKKRVNYGRRTGT